MSDEDAARAAGPSADGPPAPERAVIVERAPFPTAAAIASAAAAGVLIFLLLPGTLLYPTASDASAAAFAVRIERERAIIEGLRERLARLEDSVDGEVCLRDGAFYDVEPDPADPSAPPRPPEGAAPREDLPVDPEIAAPQPDAGGVTPENVDTIREWMDQGTVLVLRLSPDGSQVLSNGTGFFVDAQHVLTNGHVASTVGGRVWIASRALGPGVTTAEVVHTVDTNAATGGEDFALLRLSAPASGVTPYTFAAPERVAAVLANGFPGFLTDREVTAFIASLAQDPQTEAPEPVSTQGSVVAVRTLGGAQTIAHTADIFPGNSGGPLFDRCGRVVGVNTYIQSGETSPELVQSTPYAQGQDAAVAYLRSRGLSPSVSPDACGAGGASEDGADEG